MEAIKIFATYARLDGGDWRLTAVSALSAERARSLAEQEQRRPGSALRGASLTVREFASMRAVPWRLADAA
jgi:hypothetical protein